MSHQNGWVEIRGKRSKVWYGHYETLVTDPTTGEVKRRHRGVSLGPKSGMTKWDAEEKLRQIVSKETGSTPEPKNDDAVTLGWFVNNRWIPFMEGGWKDSTKETNKQIIRSCILNKLEHTPLRDFDKFKLQTHLNQVATTQSKGRVLHTRIFLMSIFEEAVDQNFLATDPARKLKVPQTRPTDKTVLEWEQLKKVLDGLAERDRLICEVGLIEAVRPSELFAFRWRCFDGESLRIEETIYRGQLRPWAKTEGSLSRVYLPAGLANKLSEWKSKHENVPADGFIFPNDRGGAILCYNYLRRIMKPLQTKLGLPKLNFQVLRRSFATLAQHTGSVKDIQGHLRHSSPSTTANEYMQVVPEGVRSMVDSMYAKLHEKPKPAPKQPTRLRLVKGA